MKRILVAEDEKSIREFIVINLKRNGYEVFEAQNGEEAIRIYDNCGGNIDMALLDIMMPVLDGIEVCKQLRKRSKMIGIIFLTAKTQEMDKVTGLLVGADDYVTKPFSPSELMARVDAVYRRVTVNRSMGVDIRENNNTIELGDYCLNLHSRTLIKKGEQIELTQVEFQIIEYFFNHPGSPVGRMDLLNHVWGANYYGDEKVVDVNIRRLRMKLEDDPSSPKHLLTIWGVGYKWQI
jgi:DNA-binding response OmpR family regulator